jgi:hypothetical protein
MLCEAVGSAQACALQAQLPLCHKGTKPPPPSCHAFCAWMPAAALLLKHVMLLFVEAVCAQPCYSRMSCFYLLKQSVCMQAKQSLQQPTPDYFWVCRVYLSYSYYVCSPESSMLTVHTISSFSCSPSSTERTHVPLPPSRSPPAATRPGTAAAARSLHTCVQWHAGGHWPRSACTPLWTLAAERMHAPVDTSRGAHARACGHWSRSACTRLRTLAAARMHVCVREAHLRHGLGKHLHCLHRDCQVAVPRGFHKRCGRREELRMQFAHAHRGVAKGAPPRVRSAQRAAEVMQAGYASGDDGRAASEASAARTHRQPTQQVCCRWLAEAPIRSLLREAGGYGVLGQVREE